MDSKNEAKAMIDQGAGIYASGHVHMGIIINHHYHVELWRAGRLLWEDEFDNLVVTAGLNKYLDATLKTGLTSPTWYVMLVNGPSGSNTYAAGDTMASHSGWTENVTYSNSTRVAWTPGSVASGSVDNSGSKASFSINGSITNLAGCAMTDVSTKSGSTGTLLGVGAFSGGDRTGLQSGDTLNVTTTCSLT